MSQDKAETAPFREPWEPAGMSNASEIFPSCVQDKLFKTDRGDICLCLHEVWPSLLADLGLLGPAMLVTRSEQLAVISFRRQLDFVAVPGGTEMMELGSGLCLDINDLNAVIAGQEAHSGNLSFHFFDRDGRGVFKVLLAPGADMDGFAHLTRHYAKCPLRPTSPPARAHTALTGGFVLAEQRESFLAAWEHLDPAAGGDYLPGVHDVTWSDALRLAGRERAIFLTKVDLMKAILAAHHDNTPLQITGWDRGLHHSVNVTPRRLERCSQCFHLFDVESEAHLFFEAEMEVWVGFHGEKQTPALHIFSGKGERRGLIQKGDDSAWDRSLFDGGATGE